MGGGSAVRLVRPPAALRLDRGRPARQLADPHHGPPCPPGRADPRLAGRPLSHRRASASAKTSWTPGVRSTKRMTRTCVGVFSRVPMAIRAADSERPAVHPRRDRRERHLRSAELVSHPQAGAIGSGELIAAVVAEGVDRADRVDHPPRPEQARRRGHGLTRRQTLGVRAPPELPARREDLGAADPVDRTVHATAAEQRGVGRVDDGVGLDVGDVADEQSQARRALHLETPGLTRVRTAPGAGRCDRHASSPQRRAHVDEVDDHRDHADQPEDADHPAEPPASATRHAKQDRPEELGLLARGDVRRRRMRERVDERDHLGDHRDQP